MMDSVNQKDRTKGIKDNAEIRTLLEEIDCHITEMQEMLRQELKKRKVGIPP